MRGLQPPRDCQGAFGLFRGYAAGRDVPPRGRGTRVLRRANYARGAGAPQGVVPDAGEVIHIERRVPCRRCERPMAEPFLEPAQILLALYQRIAGGVAEHVRMNGQLELRASPAGRRA